LHGYFLECPKRVWTDTGQKTIPATIPCLHPTGFICKNLRQFNSYVGLSTYLLGYELKKTYLQCKITMADAKMKIQYMQQTIMEDANLLNKISLTMGKSLVDL
jgi:hypothetical protein